MSEPTAPAPAPRPVSLLAVAAILALMSLFWVLTMRVYALNRPPAPQNETPDNLAKDLAWKATPATRRAYLAQLRNSQAAQGIAYAWIDQKAGIVQLPIERAMELVVEQNAKH